MPTNSSSLDTQQFASREQFSRQSRNYGTGHILARTEDIEAAFADIVLPSGASALDVATGGGHTAVWLAGAGYHVTASDLSEEMLARATELAASRDVPIQTIAHTAEEFPFADQSFDVVTCRVAAHHFSDPARFVREVARVLRPSGWFVLIDGSVPDGDPESAEWIHKVEKLRDSSHGRFLSPAEWRSLAGNAGLRVVDSILTPLKQPDLEAYFETASTPEANRIAARQVVAGASAHVREVFQLGNEEGRVVWWWPRLTLRARKAV